MDTNRQRYAVVLNDITLAIYRQVLGKPDVAPEDDFFDLGGDSIMAIEALSLMEAQLGVELPVGLIFAYRTAAELAGEIVQTAAQPS